MKNIYYYSKIPKKDFEILYKKMFLLQYQHIFLPELSVLMKKHSDFYEPSKNYIDTLKRELFDSCIYLLRSKNLNKENIDVIKDIYMQFSAYSFDKNENKNLLIRNLGAKNVKYSLNILNNFENIYEEDTFINLLPLFHIKDKNILIDEIKNNYID